MYRRLAGTNNIQVTVMLLEGRTGNAEFGSSYLFF
jgi:hypothetical protein